MRGNQVEPLAGPAPGRRVFGQGVLVNVLNPKTALFFLSFIPQFIDPGRGSVATQMLLLGVTFIAIAVTSDSAYALAASAVRGFLVARPSVLRGRRYVTGSTYIALGIVAAAVNPADV
jgi:threonine/homoserine/homoserine lactone efflux protein